MREPERLDVEFKTSMSKSDNCICNACHGGGTVMKLTYPITIWAMDQFGEAETVLERIRDIVK